MWSDDKTILESMPDPVKKDALADDGPTRGFVSLQLDQDFPLQIIDAHVRMRQLDPNLGRWLRIRLTWSPNDLRANQDSRGAILFARGMGIIGAYVDSLGGAHTFTKWLFSHKAMEVN
jgi:hypothetical protein